MAEQLTGRPLTVQAVGTTGVTTGGGVTGGGVTGGGVVGGGVMGGGVTGGGTTGGGVTGGGATGGVITGGGGVTGGGVMGGGVTGGLTTGGGFGVRSNILPAERAIRLQPAAPLCMSRVLCPLTSFGVNDGSIRHRFSQAVCRKAVSAAACTCVSVRAMRICLQSDTSLATLSTNCW